MPNFDIRKWLNSPLAENITYNGNVPAIRAIVTRNNPEQLAVQNVNNGSYVNTMEIEVSIDDVPTIQIGKVGGDKVTLVNIEGQMVTMSVIEILKFDPLARSFKLGLA